MVTNSSLHYHIIKDIIDNGFAPSVEDLTDTLNANKEEVIKGLYELQEYHGVVLHPNEPKVWVIHPFSLAPDWRKRPLRYFFQPPFVISTLKIFIYFYLYVVLMYLFYEPKI